MHYVDLTATLTLEEALRKLGKSYQSIDVRTLARKSDGQWCNVITVIRFSHETKNQIGERHVQLFKRFGKLVDDEGGVLLRIRDFSDWPDFTANLLEGYIDFIDHSVKSNLKIDDFLSSICSNSLHTFEDFRTDLFPRISCSVRFDSGKELYIGNGRFGQVALNENELAKNCLGFESQKSNGLVLELPICARIADMEFVEQETATFKLISHSSLKHEIGFALLQKTNPPGRMEFVRIAKTFEASNLNWTEGEEFSEVQIDFDIEKHEFVRSDLLESRMFTDFGVVDTERLFLRECIPIPSRLEGESPNAVEALSLCDGWKRIEEMLGLRARDSPFTRNKEDAYLVGVSWLLEIIGLKVFQLEFKRAGFTLGLITSEEESNDRFEIGDIDLLAYDDENEEYFAIDCTLNPPDSKKADLIANCAERIELGCNVRCEPMIMVSNRAADAKENLKAASILDKEDISGILDLILDGRIEEARGLFNNLTSNGHLGG